MNGGDMLLRLRRYLNDYIEPYYIPDPILFTFLTDAQLQFAQHTRVMRRNTVFTTVAKHPWYDLEDEGRVLEFRRAQLVLESGVRIGLELRGVMDKDTGFVSDYGVLLSGNSQRTGRPTALVFGAETNMVRIVPTPDAEYTIEASLVLLPEFGIDDNDSVPEVDERYHSMIVTGAAALAVEAFPDLDNNKGAMLERFSQSWARMLAQTRSEVGGISREASTVRFSNDYW